MVLVQCPADRWQAHRAIAAQFSTGSKRDHLWRFAGEGEALVRRSSGELDVPQSGDVVNFRIDCVPVTKVRGKRLPITLTEDFIRDWFVDRISQAIEIRSVSARPMRFTITKEDQAPFTRQYARVIGSGRVLIQAELESIMRLGLGDAKAYGFGLLEVERNAS